MEGMGDVVGVVSFECFLIVWENGQVECRLSLVGRAQD